MGALGGELGDKAIEAPTRQNSSMLGSTRSSFEVSASPSSETPMAIDRVEESKT